MPTRIPMPERRPLTEGARLACLAEAYAEGGQTTDHSK